RQLRVMEDLVRPGPADACDRPLVAQKRMEPTRFRGEDLAERLGAETKRLRPEMGQLRLGRFRREQPDAGPLLRAGFREHELGAALEAEAKGRCLRTFFADVEVA